MHFFKNKLTKRLTVLIILYLTFLQTVLPLYFAKEFVLFLFYSLGLSLFFLLYNFKRVIIFAVLKKSTVFKKKYKFLILKKKKLKEKLFLNIIFLLSFLINTHKRYKFFFYLLLLMSGMLNENFKFCVFICLNALFDFIYNHSLFQHVKKKIERDTIIYHTHWSEDTDLKVITKLLRLLFVLGLFIFIFSFTPPMFIGSHFLKLFPFTFDGYQFDLGVIQLVLAVHLIGPKILLFVFLVKLLCDIHIIFFRNSKTK